MPLFFSLDVPVDGINTYRLEIVDKHPVLINFLDKKYIIDTGSPVSMTVDNQPFLLCGKSNESSSLNIMDTVVSLSGLDVDGIIGLDLLSKYYVLIDYKNKKISFSSRSFQMPGKKLTMDKVLGMSAIGFQATVNGQPTKCLLDTGAPISYLAQPRLFDGLELEKAGQADDFYPGLGHFTTQLYKTNVEIEGVDITVKCGVLPSLLSLAVSMAGGAILGYDLISQTDGIELCFNENTIKLAI